MESLCNSCERREIARRRTEEEGAEAFFLCERSEHLDRAGAVLSSASDDDGGGLRAPRIARRCPGRTREQTRFSSASERGRQRLQRRDPRERSEQSNIAQTPKETGLRRAEPPGHRTSQLDR